MRRHLPVAAVLLAAHFVHAADDLRNPFRDVPAARNGWGLLLAAGALVTGDKSVPLCPPDYPDLWHPQRPGVLRHLEVNAPALARFEDALTRPEMVAPPSEATWSRNINFGGQCRELGRLKEQRAFLRRDQGDLVGALGDLDDLLTFGDRRDDGGGTLDDYMTTRCIVEEMGMGGVRELLGPPPRDLDPALVDPAELWPVMPFSPAERGALMALSRHVADESRCLSALRGAYGGELAILAYELPRPANYEHQPASPREVEQALSYRREVYAALHGAAAQAPWRRDFAPVRAIRQPAQIGVSGSMGHLCLRISPYELRMTRFVDGDRAERRMTVTAIAIRLFAADHGRLPSSLADLVADGLLPAVPLDPFDGRPLRYLPRQGLLYCVGRDRRDQGGTRGVDYRARLDFVVTTSAWQPDANHDPEPWPPHQPRDHGDRSLF